MSVENLQKLLVHDLKDLYSAEKQILQEDMPEPVRDAAMIGAAQKVEHYEMAAYGTAREMAERLGLKDAARLLQQTLDEEGETDKLLTAIAQRVNPQAEAAD